MSFRLNEYLKLKDRNYWLKEVSIFFEKKSYFSENFYENFIEHNSFALIKVTKSVDTEKRFNC